MTFSLMPSSSLSVFTSDFLTCWSSASVLDLISIMRLINTSTLLLEEFIGRAIPRYAILSHTWEDDEVTFKGYSDGTHRNKKGFQKITNTCAIVARSGLAYVWVDTCCIDKSSSAELTEAINSMFRWYERAEVCYTFLSDMPGDTSDFNGLLPRCRWL
jgi:hypothetical protein